MTELKDLLEALKNSIGEDSWYTTKPVSPDEFFSSRYYVGDMCDSIFPCWRRELNFVLDPANKIKEWILYGSLGCGKSVAALLSQVYVLYKLTCMESPQTAFGLAPHFPMYLAFFNIVKEKAQQSLVDRFNSLINMSPYFREILPKNLRKVFVPHGAGMFGPGYREHPKRDDLFEVILPHNIHLLFGSKTSHALSLDVFSAVLDEMNFRSKASVSEQEDENSAANLYTSIYRRITSRFVDHPGLLVNISSARSSESFIERRIAEVEQGKLDNVHVSAFAHWEARPDRYKSGKTFRVFVGNKMRRSRILKDGEDIEVAPGERIIDVPEELRKDFERDINMAVRDLAGVATADVGKLFAEASIVYDAVDKSRWNPLPQDVIIAGTRTPERLEDFFDQDAVSVFNNIERRLRYFQGVRRFIHVDLSIRKDRSGIACGCIPKFRVEDIESTDAAYRPTKVQQRLPYFFLDFAFAIQAPTDDEINYEAIRRFILWVARRVGYYIELVTYDSYQSVDSTQLLRASGLNADRFSVDATDAPYLELAAAFRERRVSVPAGTETLLSELVDLKHDISSAKGKVDHPVGGSKDIADAVCGSYAAALRYMESVNWAAPGVERITEKIIASELTNPKRAAKAKAHSKWLGMKEPVHLDDSLDERIPG